MIYGAVNRLFNVVMLDRSASSTPFELGVANASTVSITPTINKTNNTTGWLSAAVSFHFLIAIYMVDCNDCTISSTNAPEAL